MARRRCSVLRDTVRPAAVVSLYASNDADATIFPKIEFDPAIIKERLEVAFLAPMRNPELRKLYGKSLRGGLLLYGPPGCGKSMLAGRLPALLPALITGSALAFSRALGEYGSVVFISGNMPMKTEIADPIANAAAHRYMTSTACRCE